MIGSKITITNELAQAVGELAQDHPDAAVSIAYDDEYPEQEWLVELDVGWGTATYVVNDETGEYRQAGMGENIKSEVRVMKMTTTHEERLANLVKKRVGGTLIDYRLKERRPNGDSEYFVLWSRGYQRAGTHRALVPADASTDNLPILVFGDYFDGEDALGLAAESFRMRYLGKAPRTLGAV